MTHRTLPVLSAFFLVACVSQTQTGHESALDVHSSLRSYAVLDHAVGQRASIDDQLEAAIHERLGELEYERVPAAEADLLVSYKLLLSDERHVAVAPLQEPLLAPVGDVGNFGGAQVFVEHVHMDEAQELNQASQEKVLLVLVQERRTMRTLWLGWASGRVDSEDIDSRTLSALSEVMTRLPPAGSN
ncbi:MAG: DUF4136 domain-containing protein [Polyangiales bacterium]